MEMFICSVPNRVNVACILVSSQDPCLPTGVICSPWGCKPSILHLDQSTPRSSNSGHPASEVTHLHEPEGQGSLLGMVCQDREKEFSLSSVEGDSRNRHSWHGTGSNCCSEQVG